MGDISPLSNWASVAQFDFMKTLDDDIEKKKQENIQI